MNVARLQRFTNHHTLSWTLLCSSVSQNITLLAERCYATVFHKSLYFVLYVVRFRCFTKCGVRGERWKVYTCSKKTCAFRVSLRILLLDKRCNTFVSPIDTVWCALYCFQCLFSKQGIRLHRLLWCTLLWFPFSPFIFWTVWNSCHVPGFFLLFFYCLVMALSLLSKWITGSLFYVLCVIALI